MIYYIVGVEENGNEWVLSSHDNAERAAHYLENYRATVVNEGTTYRIDTVPSTKDEINAINARIPVKPGIFEIAAEQAARFEATVENGDYTLTELFGWYDGKQASERIINCHVCGCVVSYDNEMMNLHQTFHNKLLP